METIQQSTVQNRLLAMLPSEIFNVLAPELRHVPLPRNVFLAEPDEPFEQVYFLETGIGSVVTTSPEGLSTESGLFGRDGFTPLAAVLGSDRSPYLIVMQVGGDGHSLAVDTLTRAMAESSVLSQVMLRFVQTFTVQTAYTALSNAVHPVNERLARWLLMCHDRLDSNEMQLTHDFLAVMLSVRRPSVTTALHALEGNRLIVNERGYITVRDRKRLEEFAGDAYGKPEEEYRRLLGAM
jgi:CRP-like cAMP-binding protein